MDTDSYADVPPCCFEVRQEVFILLVRGDPLAHRAVGRATIERIDEDGTLWVSTPKGHNCPWKCAPDEVFLLKAEAETALKAWQDSLPDIADLCAADPLG